MAVCLQCQTIISLFVYCTCCQMRLAFCSVVIVVVIIILIFIANGLCVVLSNSALSVKWPLTDVSPIKIDDCK